ncbi:MAG: outer membrane beta-barrel protein [Flavitalea sp.]
MDRDFYTDEFEDLIKQKADQFRMYPSERVWKQINKNLHPRRKWYMYGFALLLSGLGLYSLNELSSPVQVASIQEPSTDQQTSEIEPSVLQPEKMNPFKQVEKHTTAAKVIPIISTYHGRSQGDNNSLITALSSEQLPSNITVDNEIKEISGATHINDGSASGSINNFTHPELASVNISPVAQVNDRNLSFINSSDENQNEVNGIAEKSIELVKQQLVMEEIPEYSKRVNWLHDQIVHQVGQSKWNRMSFQVAAAPTMNYRILRGGQPAHLQSNIRNIPLSLSIPGEVDRLVNHKPGYGFELGTTAFYAVTKKFSIKAGFQFNYSRYLIEAYRAPTQITSIALNRNAFSAGSVQSLSSLNNFGGYSEKDIQNQYFQISAPFGAEMNILGKRKLQLHVAATIQPTYLLNRSSYMITNDFKSYTQSPSLVRRWNMNTAAEAFISYKTGGVRWQIGPQFRYQLLSSYIKEYPISEYLMEYGVKFGVTKTIR